MDIVAALKFSLVLHLLEQVGAILMPARYFPENYCRRLRWSIPAEDDPTLDLPTAARRRSQALFREPG